MKLYFTLVLSVFVSVSAMAADCMTQAPKGSRWKECKNARSNVSVDQYLLSTDGDLYTYIEKIDRLCQVTNNVKDFKISIHPRDAAVLYFERSGDLYVANEVKVKGDCPEMKKKVIMTNVKKYNVVGNTKTTIVNTALSQSGEFVAWDNVKPVYKDILVEDYLLNRNYGSEGKSFSSYVAFTLGMDHYVTKVKGQKDGSYIKSKDSGRAYRDLQSFKRDMNID